MRIWIVGVVGKRGLGLRYCRSPLPFVEEDLRLRHMGPRIVRLKSQSGVGQFVCTRKVARGVVAPEILHPIGQCVRHVDHRALVLRVERQRALAEVDDAAIERLTVAA